MNRADVELLNQSIGSLGNSFLQNRQMSQAADERELDRQLKQQMLDETVAQRRESTDARKAHYGAMEATAASNAQARTDAAATKQQELQNRAKDFAHKSWDNTMRFFSTQVKDGLMDPDKASASLQNAYANMPDQGKQALADNPSVLAMQAGGINWNKPPEQQAPAAVAQLKTAREWEMQADDIEGDDPEQANKLRTDATALRQHLQKSAAPGLRKSVTMGGVDPLTKAPLAPKVSLSGPAGDVDAAMAKPGAPGAVNLGDEFKQFLQGQKAPPNLSSPFQPPQQ